jgi:hypothetical protein
MAHIITKPDAQRQGHQSINIHELIEAILFYLEPREIVRASGTCRYWHSCLKESPTLLRKIHKMPVACIEGTNPHFIEPSQACRDAVTTSGRPDILGSNVLALYERADAALLENAHPQVSEQELKILRKNYGVERYEYRTGFTGVRYPKGWPVGLRETHCDLCDGFHPQFRFEHVHPLLSFLEDMTLCIRGYGPRLYVNFKILQQWQALGSCYDHYCAEVRMLSKRLKWAHTSMEQGNLHDDLLMRPVCRRLVAPTNTKLLITDNANGITLAEAIPFFIRAFKAYLSASQKIIHSWLLRVKEGRVMRHARMRCGFQAAFPTTEDWDEFDKNFESFVEMWDKAVLEADKMMRGVAAWDETQL